MEAWGTWSAPYSVFRRLNTLSTPLQQAHLQAVPRCIAGLIAALGVARTTLKTSIPADERSRLGSLLSVSSESQIRDAAVAVCMQLAGLSPCLDTGPVQLTHGVAHLFVLPAADIVSHWTWAGEHLVEAGSLSAAVLEEAIARQKFLADDSHAVAPWCADAAAQCEATTPLHLLGLSQSPSAAGPGHGCVELYLLVSPASAAMLLLASSQSTWGIQSGRPNACLQPPCYRAPTRPTSTACLGPSGMQPVPPFRSSSSASWLFRSR